MHKIYRDDDGHEMEEADFVAYLNLKIKEELISGIPVKEALKYLEEDYWGDSIIDKIEFERIKQTLTSFYLKS